MITRFAFLSRPLARARASLMAPEGWAILLSGCWGWASLLGRLVGTSRSDPALIGIAAILAAQSTLHAGAVLRGSFHGAQWAAGAGALVFLGQAAFYLTYSVAALPIGVLFIVVALQYAQACLYPSLPPPVRAHD